VGEIKYGNSWQFENIGLNRQRGEGENGSTFISHTRGAGSTEIKYQNCHHSAEKS